MARSCATLLCLMICLPAQATDLRSVLTQHALASWSEKDGLPDANIYVLEQDADGYLWIGTQAGPYRFDGVRFTPWSALVDGAQPSGVARALNAASDGSMWIGFGGEGGVAVFRRGLQRVYGTDDGLPAAAVSVLLEHPAGTFWAGTSAGLFRLQGTHWQQIGMTHGVPAGAVSVGMITAQRQLVIGSARSLLQLDAATDTFRAVAVLTEDARALAEDPQGRIMVSDQVKGYRHVDEPRSGAQGERGRGRALLRDQRGNLWVGTAGQGLWRVRFDQRGDPPTVEHANALTGLLADGILSLTEDREGNIWAGTTEGINRLTPYKVGQVTDIGLVVGVEPRPDGAVWVGTVDELLRMPVSAAPRQPLPHLLRGARLRAMHTDDTGMLWVATDRGLARWVDDALVPVPTRGEMPQQIDTITSGAAGEAWVFDAARGLLRWRAGEFVPTPLPVVASRVEATFTDSRQRAWFALSSGDVVAAIGDELRVYGKADGLDAGVYQAIYEDHDHVIWLGGTNGLSRYQNGSFVTVRSDRGFPVANLTAIVEDTRGELWIGSGVGILQLRRADFERLLGDPGYDAQYRLLDRSDGLAGLPFAYSRNRRAVRSRDGRLWFVTGRGLTIVDPAALETTASAPSVRIEGVLSNGVRMHAENGLRLPAGTGRVEFEYTAVNLTSPLRQHFRYKLEGFDRDWIDGGTRRQTLYTNLPPRNYRFRVTSTDLNGDWVEAGAAWDFRIEPMFYQTGWFLVVGTAALAATIGGAWRLHVRRVRRRFALLIGERARLSRELHDTLLQSLVGVALQFDAMANDPQFSFSPAQKQQFVRMRKRVEEYMREARQSIADLRSSPVNTEDLPAALHEAAVRAINGDRIQFSFAQRGLLPPIPARIKQQLLKIGREAIGNAARHSHADRIVAELEYANDVLCFRVIDNGTGFDPEVSTADDHYGLTSMRERAQDIGGRLTISTTTGSGTRIETVVPLRQRRGSANAEVTTD